jgi:hypothetical protein
MIKIVAGLAVLVVIMITIPVLLAWSQSRRRLRVEAVGGEAVLRMPRGHWALLSVIAILPFSILSVFAFVVEWQPGAETSGLVLGAVMGLAGIVSGGYLLALELRGCIRLREAGIEKQGALGSRQVGWGEVARITFNPVNNWFFLTGPGGKTIYFGEGLDGIGTFADYALRRLPPKVLEASPEAEEALQELAKS